MNLIYVYLSDISQKAKVGSSFSAFLDITYGVPQGSILRPLLFNIDISDLFFAYDTTLYECGEANVCKSNLFIFPHQPVLVSVRASSLKAAITESSNREKYT